MSKASTVRTFATERETKRMVRFTELPQDDQPILSGTLYVSKEALAKLGNPSSITVTVEASQ
jgi:hypothetical protein